MSNLSMMEASALRDVFTAADPSIKTALMGFFENEQQNYADDCMRAMLKNPPDTTTATQCAAQSASFETAIERLHDYMTKQWERYV